MAEVLYEISYKMVDVVSVADVLFEKSYKAALGLRSQKQGAVPKGLAHRIILHIVSKFTKNWLYEGLPLYSQFAFLVYCRLLQ